MGAAVAAAILLGSTLESVARCLSHSSSPPSPSWRHYPATSSIKLGGPGLGKSSQHGWGKHNRRPGACQRTPSQREMLQEGIPDHGSPRPPQTTDRRPCFFRASPSFSADRIQGKMASVCTTANGKASLHQRPLCLSHQNPRQYPGFASYSGLKAMGRQCRAPAALKAAAATTVRARRQQPPSPFASAVVEPHAHAFFPACRWLPGPRHSRWSAGRWPCWAPPAASASRWPCC